MAPPEVCEVSKHNDHRVIKPIPFTTAISNLPYDSQDLCPTRYGNAGGKKIAALICGFFRIRLILLIKAISVPSD
jgi:hypothetical protein